MRAKLTSRKLWVALAGVCTGIGLCVAGSITEGTATIITSVLGYILAEGIIDAKSVSNTANALADILGDIIDGVDEDDEDEEETE